MEQPDLFDSWGAAVAGAEQAADHADAVSPGWRDEAFDVLQEFIRLHRTSFLIEDVRIYARERGLPEPPDERAWGAVALRAKAAKLIVKIGYGYTTHGPMHACPRGRWEVVRPDEPEPELRWPIRRPSPSEAATP